MRRSRSSKNENQSAQETGEPQSKTGMWLLPAKNVACCRVSYLRHLCFQNMSGPSRLSIDKIMAIEP